MLKKISLLSVVIYFIGCMLSAFAQQSKNVKDDTLIGTIDKVSIPVFDRGKVFLKLIEYPDKEVNMSLNDAVKYGLVDVKLGKDPFGLSPFPVPIEYKQVDSKGWKVKIVYEVNSSRVISFKRIKK
jgi:hypothetical protein